MKTGKNSKLVPDPIAEHSGGLVDSNYWIKLGIPRNYLPKLRDLGQRVGFEKAPIAAAARIIALVGLQHLDQIEEWVCEHINAQKDRFLFSSTELKGVDPAAN